MIVLKDFQVSNIFSGKILNLNPYKAIGGDICSAMSPLFNSSIEKCLSFNLYRKRDRLDDLARLRIYGLDDEKAKVLLWENKFIGSENEGFWSVEYVRLPAGLYNIVFEGIVGLSVSLFLAIHQLEMEEKDKCENLTNTIGEVTKYISTY